MILAHGFIPPQAQPTPWLLYLGVAVVGMVVLWGLFRVVKTMET